MQLQFRENTADEAEGLNHPGIETYMDQPYGCTARECGQNSADARRELPVVLKFDRISVTQKDFASLATLQAAVKSCLERATSDKNDKAIEFFQHAVQQLAKAEIPSLRIEDFNTNGLRGPCTAGTPFHALVKATGVSTEKLSTSGGSFGIGKFAAFAISDLRTVFYSTIYSDNGGEHFLAQGKSILMSHNDEQGTPRLATGYWGGGDYSPIDDVDQVPEWLRRSKRGTTLVALGFRDAPNWEYRMAASLIRNFFVAVHRGDMEFSLDDGTLQIDASTLPQLFEHEGIVAAAEVDNHGDELAYAKCLYRCLTSEEANTVELKVPQVGTVNVRILIEEGFPKRVSIIRNGMLITDSLEHFGDKFARFPGYRDFVAMVEPIERDGSKFIKQLENPRHDELSAERIRDEVKRESAAKAMTRLAKKIRESIRSEAVTVPEKVESLDELSRFFADTQDVDHIPHGESEPDPERLKYEAKSRRPVRPPTPEIPGTDGDGSGGDGTLNGDGGTRYGDTAGSGIGDGTRGGKKRLRQATIREARNRVEHLEGRRNRTVWFTPCETGELMLCLFTPGLSSREEIRVATASLGDVVNGRIVLDVVADQRQRIDVSFTVDHTGPVEIVAYTESEEEE